MKKIAIVHPKMNEAGGSEARPMWVMQALKDRYDVTFITMGEFDLARFNEIHGTTIDPSEVRIVTLSIPFWLKKRFDALKDYRLHRYCKAHKEEYDLFISTYNVMDFGKRGIQCIADFSFDDTIRRSLDPSSKNKVTNNDLFRKLYIGLSERLKGISRDGWKRNITIANSDWSGEMMRKHFGVESVTVYPSVRTEFPSVAWEAKHEGFVNLGRISSEKNQDSVIEIVKEVRERFDVSLHLVGPLPHTPYAERLRQMAQGCSDWLKFEGGVYGEEKLRLLANFKYAIHGRASEPFGIAVAELVKARAIVWVPDGGGQTEIVAHPMLVYTDKEDAVKKIVQVLSDAQLQQELRQHLARQAERFSTLHFMRGIQKAVEHFFKEER